MNSSSRCRLCLSQYDVTVPIFKQPNNNNTDDVLPKIRKFTAIKISEDDRLPKYICNSCLKLLELFHQFSVTTANSEIKLLQAISSESSPNTTAATITKNRRRDAETPPIGRVFSFTETLRSLKVREKEPESIYSPAKEAATAIHDEIRLYTPASENDSYENIFYTFRNCYSLEGIKPIDSHNYITEKNSPNIIMPQLQVSVSQNEFELYCEDMEHTEERPRTTQGIQDGRPEGVQFQNVIDTRTSDYKCELTCRTFYTIDEYLDSDAESQGIHSLNSEMYHSGLGYVHDLDRDVQVTLVDEHLLPLSLSTKKHAPLRWLLDYYCKLSGNTPNQIGFQFNGRLIKDSSTACELGLRHGDMLHVVLLWQQAPVSVAQRIRYFER